MLPESTLVESRSLRDSVTGRTEVLDKVKALELLPDRLHVTTQMVADYYEVSERAVNNLLNRHREELESNGLHVLRGSDLQEYQSFKMKLSSEGEESYPQRRSSLALWPRRAVLNAGMLLRDSAVARRVRTYLLDAEEHVREADPVAYEDSVLGPILNRIAGRLDHIDSRLERVDTRLERVETRTERIENRLDRLEAYVGWQGVRLERIDGRTGRIERQLASTDEVICAMSVRLCLVNEKLPEPGRQD